jgi:molecular chaperone DnaK
VYTAEKALKDHGDKVGEDIKTGIRTNIEAVNKTRGGDDVAAIKSASESLSTAMQKIGESLSKQSGQSAEGEQPKTHDAGPESDK